MSSIENLLKRSTRLQAHTSTTRLDEEWDGLVAGARESLLAKFQDIKAQYPEATSEVENMTTEQQRERLLELKAELAERAAEAKAQWMRARQ